MINFVFVYTAAKVQKIFHLCKFLHFFFVNSYFFYNFAVPNNFFMRNKTIFLVLFLAVVGCRPHPSQVELMRAAKAQKDSVQYAQACQTILYSDSLLQTLLPQVDPLMKAFVYEKDDKAEDHGHYVHRVLRTTSNTQRNFLQAYVRDNKQVSLTSYFYGSHPIHHNHIKLSVGELYLDKEGSLYSFEVEGVHEMLTVENADALQFLQFVAEHASERVLVTAYGASKVTYYLNDTEKNALTQTFQLAVLMSDIDRLERAIHVASLQKAKYEKKQANL